MAPDIQQSRVTSLVFTSDLSIFCSRYHPLRIEYNSDKVCIVTYDITTPASVSSGIGQSSRIPHLFDATTLLYRPLKGNVDKAKNIFQRYAANTRYYRSLLAEEIERLNQAGSKVLVDGKDRGQIFEKLHNLEQITTRAGLPERFQEYVAKCRQPVRCLG